MSSQEFKDYVKNRGVDFESLSSEETRLWRKIYDNARFLKGQSFRVIFCQNHNFDWLSFQPNGPFFILASSFNMPSYFVEVYLKGIDNQIKG